jgi:hypothetical protein
MMTSDVLAILRVHRQTTLNAGINTIGMTETIDELEKLNPTEEILCFGLAVDSKHLIGNCYTDVNIKKLIGCVFAERKQ